MKININPVILFGSSIVVLWSIVNFAFLVITLSAYSVHSPVNLPDPNQALIALFTGLAFVAAGAAYWVQNKALKAAKKQTAIAKEQRMDAACFELLNYLEIRKKAIGDDQPFKWIEKVYKLQDFPEDHVTDLQESGTWYRCIILWLDRVINMFPDDPQLQKQYIDNVLFSLSINEQRCLKCYSCCADGIKFQKDETILQTVQKYKKYLRSFIKTRQNKDKIEQNLQSFFDDESLYTL